MKLTILAKRIAGNILRFDNQKDSYYERIIRLKPVIASDAQMLERIASAFEYEYGDKNSVESPRMIGFGDVHTLYNVGFIRDPANERGIHVAVRLWHHDKHPYNLEERAFLLAIQLYEFEKAFENGLNPPYFAGVATWKKGGHGKRVAGFILEDVSENRKYKLTETEGWRSFFYREGTFRREKFFLDPSIIGDIEAHQYLEDRARIDLI